MHTQANAKYEFIDALRGIAFLMVLISHGQRFVEIHSIMGASHPLNYWVHAYAEQGARGVQLFFVISALTLCLSAYHRKTEINAVCAFFIRRAFRILPMYYLAFFYFAIFPILTHRTNGVGINFKDALRTVTFTTGWAPSWTDVLVPGGWSVSVEMAFYCIFPLLIIFVSTFTRAILAFLLSAAFGLACNVYAYGGLATMPIDVADWFHYAWLPGQLPIFMLGFVLYFCIFGEKALVLSKLLHRRYMLLALAILCAGFFMTLPFIEQGLVPRHWLYGILFFGVVIVLKNVGPNLLTCGPIRFIGQCSFSSYLIHFAVLPYVGRALNKIHLNDIDADYYFTILVMVTLVVTVAVSAATYTLVEIPGQKIGKKLISWVRQRRSSRLLATA
jgi:peptidoglycan/LPS O-acetylase OafA/YrhL